ncbi:MAG: phosphatidoglycerophosphate synthase [uncultured bacterium]|nr:MAG: phosphatidoglycerophosphate synthase [uncultured bacterium]
MLETHLRSFYQRYFIDPVVKFYFIRSISPNWFTLAACVIGMSVFPMLWLKQYGIATLLLLISGYCDTLDGTLARNMNKTSNIGTVYDILSDRIVECAVILGLFTIDTVHRGAFTLAMLSSVLICVTSFLVVGIFTSNNTEKSFYYSPGLIERAEAFIFFIIMIWLPQHFNLLASLFTILVLCTAYYRIRQFTNEQQIESSSRLEIPPAESNL